MGKELAFHVLENPVGRLKRFIGPSDYTFNPSEYGGYLNPPDGFVVKFETMMQNASDDVTKKKAAIAWAMQWDAYTKRTCLWGYFNRPVKKLVYPVLGSILWAQYGGKSERTKEMRSMTPKGFARAFFEANNPDSKVNRVDSM